MDPRHGERVGPDLCLWGKTLPGNRTYPLLAHLLDTGAVLRAYLDGGWATPQMLGHLSAITGVAPDQLYQALPLLAALHDVGKLTPEFQGRSELLDHCSQTEQPLRNTIAHYEPFVVKGSGPGVQQLGRHAFTSGLAHRRRYGAGNLAADILAGHHGRFPVRDISREKERRGGFGSGSSNSTIAGCEALWTSDAASGWVEQWEQHQSACEAAFGHHDVVVTSHAALPLLTHLVVLADWVASSSMVGTCDLNELEDPRQYSDQQREVAASALRGLLGAPPPDRSKCSFGELFPSFAESTTELQSTVRALPSTPGLTVIAAPMGVGKTEAALSRCLDGRTGLYFALPTGATAASMFDRVLEFMEHHGESGETLYGNLLHRGAALNDFYAGGTADGRANSGDQSTRVEAGRWLSGRHKALLAPVSVGTVDRILHGVLPHKYGFLKLGAMAGRTVVLDEVHSYDAYTARLVNRLIAWLGACGADVVVLSATLPTEVTEEMLESWADGVRATGGQVTLPDEVPEYPFVVHLQRDGSTPVQATVPADTSVLELEYFPVKSPEGLAAQLASCLEGLEPCHSAIICNTVDYAQQAAEALGQLMPSADVVVLHSRMPAAMRAEYTQLVAAKFGRRRADRPGQHTVLVSTQVAEQSLDFDVDVMVSQLAPIASLLQRSGRLWRHQRGWRPTSRVMHVSRPNTTMDRFPYGHDGSAVRRTWTQVLDGGERRSIEVPGELQHLVNLGYDTSSTEDLGEKISNDTLTGEAVQRAIPAPSAVRLASELTEGADGRDEDLLTRIGVDTVQVLLVGDQPWAWNGELPTEPDRDQQRGLLGCVVPLRSTGRLTRQLPLEAAPTEWLEQAPSLAGVRVLHLSRATGVVTLDPVLGLCTVPDGDSVEGSG